jgi:hypothetical protein
MCNETTLMESKYKTDKTLQNMRRNPAAERYLKKKGQEKYNKGLAISFGLCLSVLILMFIYY